jgi:iron complex outermembrane receptor protein
MMGATAILTAMGALAFGSNADRAEAHAQMPQKEIAEIVRSYDIPAGPISTALNSVADASGVRIVYDSRLTRSYRTRGVSGSHSLAAALSEVLSGTGLSYELSPNGKSVLIVLAQAGDTRNDASAGGATPLPTIDIGSEPNRPTSRPGSGAGSQGPGDRHTGYNAVRAPSTLKTDTPLLKTPIAVEVVTRQTMDDQQAISVGDALLSNVSGVTPAANVFDLFKVRGFFNTVGNVYKNGLMEYRLRNLDTTNLQSIEVLKGPAAMLFGRGEPGGVVNMVVKRPLETPYYSLQQQVKSFSGTRTTLDATGPLTEDKSILYRFNGEFYSTDSYRNFVRDRNVFIAPTISIHPVEQFRMNIDFEYQNKTWVDDYPVLPAVGGRPANIPVSRYLSAPTVMTTMPDHFDRKRIAYDWTYDFLPDWSLTNRLSYYNVGTRNENVTGTSFNAVTGVLNRALNYFPGYTDRSFATNLDLKGKFTTGPLEHSILLGYDYFATFLPTYTYYFYNPTSAINIYAPGYSRLENPYQKPVYGVAGQKWTGVYGQDMISFLDDSVHVLLGGRYDWTDYGSNRISSSAYLASTSYVSVHAEAFSPRVGVVYQPLSWLSLYGNFTQSFGANNGTTTALMPLAPQKGEQFEGGVKAELLDKRLTLTMAYFDIFKTNIPYTDPTNSNNTLLIGKARSQGFEFDLTGRIDDNWSVIANYTHDDVRTMQGASSYNPLTLITTQLAISGSKLAASPRNYGNLWVKYDADGDLLGLSLGAGVSVYESSFGDTANTFVLPSYALLNSMVAYSTKIAGYTVTGQLNVKNITDATYYPTSTDRYTIQTGTPRTFLGSLRVEF